MQNKHSISVAGEIRRKLPSQLAIQTKSLTITLVGEQIEETKSGTTIIAKGHLEVRGEASSIHYQDKIISAIQERSGGRQVRNAMTVKRDDPSKRRTHGFF